MIGQTLNGRYTILAIVGAGSMGIVYRARQLGVERDVAIKVLRKGAEPKSRARFLREARAASSLASPHTVRVFDFGETEAGDTFLVMELLEGESLARRLARLSRLSPEEAADMGVQVLKSLYEAHTKGVIHRDLKPSNIFFARVATGDKDDEIVKVLDFGGAKFVTRPSMNAIDTQEGFIVGTPRYMSPEQACGEPLDGRSDLYALGAVLYHAVTGGPPFPGDDADVILANHIRKTPVSPREACSEADIPPALDALVLRALAKKPETRPTSAKEFARELSAFVGGPVSLPRTAFGSDSGESARVSSPPAAAPDPEAQTRPVPARSRRVSAFAAVGLIGSAFAVTYAVGLVVHPAPPPAAPLIASSATGSTGSSSAQSARAPALPVGGPRAVAVVSSSAVPIDALPRAPRTPQVAPRREPAQAPANPSAVAPATTAASATTAAPPAPPAAPTEPKAKPPSDYTYFE